MSSTIDLSYKLAGHKIIESFLSIFPYECDAHNWRGEKYNNRNRWEGEKIETYDGIQGVAIRHEWSAGYAGIFGLFASSPGWRPAISEGSGPQQIQTSTLEPDRLYTKVRLSLGREVHDAIGYAPGWHEHLEYDDVAFKADFEEIRALFVRALKIAKKSK